MTNFLIAFCLLSGAFFMLVAAIGVLRLPDLYQRLHASSKAATLGVALLLLGAALHSGDMGVVSRCLMAIAFFKESTKTPDNLYNNPWNLRMATCRAKKS